MSDRARRPDPPVTAQSAVVLGATGATGRAIAAELARRGTPVRACARDRERLESAFGSDADIRIADLLDPEQTRAAIEGCDLVFHCYGTARMDQISDHPIAARSLARALAATGARAVHVSSYWSYLPMHGSKISEDSPRAGGGIPMRARRQAEDILLEAGAAIAHLPDFFGPYVRSSTLQNPLAEAAAGRPMHWIGPKHLARDYLYIPDAARLLVDLAGHAEAYGRRWIFPGSGPVSAAGIRAIVAGHLGRRVGLRAAGGLLLRLLAHVNADLRSFEPVLDDYLKPVRYDASRLEALLGGIELTDYEQAVPETLDWLAAVHA